MVWLYSSQWVETASSTTAWVTAPTLPPSQIHRFYGANVFKSHSLSAALGFKSETASGACRHLGLRCHQMSATSNSDTPDGGVKVIYDDVFLKHRPPPGYPHPECPARVSTVRDELDGAEGVKWASPSSLVSENRKAQVMAAIERVHKADYLNEIKAICERGGGGVDSDTYVCPDTFEVCVAVSSAWMDAVESAAKGEPAFALTRPPGHHATAGAAMGFCIVCFAAVAAFHAVENLGCKKVAMLDFDVHHGNGIAALVRNEPRIRYCSIHQGGIFPGSGAADDSGPLGTLKHLPFFSAGEAWGTYEARFEEALPWLQEFDPDVVLVSAGYDALDADELATASLLPDDFGRMGRRLHEVFGNKVAFGLEGGYNVQVTPIAVRKTLEPFLGTAGSSASA